MWGHSIERRPQLCRLLYFTSHTQKGEQMPQHMVC